MKTVAPELSGDRLARLTILDFGLFHVHAGRTIGIPGYLLETAGGRRILVDTGFPPAYIRNPVEAGRRDGLDGFGTLLSPTEQQTPQGQASERVLGPRTPVVLREP